MSERNHGDVLLAFVLGAAIGAGLGILFAPRSGKETRARMKVLLEDLGEKAEGMIEEGKDKVEELIGEGKERIRRIISKQN